LEIFHRGWHVEIMTKKREVPFSSFFWSKIEKLETAWEQRCQMFCWRPFILHFVVVDIFGPWRELQSWRWRGWSAYLAKTVKPKYVTDSSRHLLDCVCNSTVWQG
jgi:hypothetical protein